MAKYVPQINPLRANRHRAGIGLGAPVRKTLPLSPCANLTHRRGRRRMANAIPQDDIDMLVSRPEPRTRFCGRFPP